MILHDFESGFSVLNRFIAEIRDIEIQKDPMPISTEYRTHRRDSVL